MPTITAATESWPIRGTFTISRGSKTSSEVVVARVEEGADSGYGECVPYARYGETIDTVLEQIRSVQGVADRDALQAALPAGAARNAIDCAFWDLECKRAGVRAWQHAGIAAPEPVVTAYTLSLDTPERMHAAALEQAHRSLLKLKLGGSDDIERVRAVRAGAPDATIIVDANEGWTPPDYEALVPALVDLGIALIEQPLPAGEDAALADLDRPIPICADESCHDRATLAGLAGRYDVANIKLDKTGGLTEALAMATQAREQGLDVMVGCMLATSLAMAPAVLIAAGARFVDLDGPLLLAGDREHGLDYSGGRVHAPTAALWG